jgi:predicted metal-dependent hydrolase
MRGRKVLPVRGKRAYHRHREDARRIITARVRHFARLHGFRFGRLTIKDTRSLWGSCSRAGNLNFSYKLMFLPLELMDYVIVHELCHLREPNHSPAFWGHVADALPRYRRLRTELRAYLLR